MGFRVWGLGFIIGVWVGFGYISKWGYPFYALNRIESPYKGTPHKGHTHVSETLIWNGIE